MNAPLDTRFPQRLGQAGQSVRDLSTPCLVLDLDAMNRNVQRMAEFIRKNTKKAA